MSYHIDIKSTNNKVFDSEFKTAYSRYCSVINDRTLSKSHCF